jgi:hypothetical protein
VQLDGVQHLEERIAYALGHNTDLQPTDTIIHLNGDRSDNRLSNLSLKNNQPARLRPGITLTER